MPRTAAGQQEDRADHRGAGAVPGVLGNLGKSAQTAALNSQIEASNLWNFFQAKNIRRTTTLVAAEQAKIDLDRRSRPAQKAAIAKQIDDWTKTAARYRSEPEAGGGKGEGTVELSRRALEEKEKRDLQLNKYHNFEFASAAFQIGIVLASAAVITSMMCWPGRPVGLGLLGLAFTATGCSCRTRCICSERGSLTPLACCAACGGGCATTAAACGRPASARTSGPSLDPLA